GAKREELIRQDAKSAEIIKPLAMGRDIKKWSIDYPDKWLIVTRIGVDIERYPAIFAHLKQWQKELEKRWDKGNHWWELRACDYYEVFDKPKIVYQEIATYQAFALDLTGAFMNNKVFMIPSYDLYLIAILNSGPVWHYLHDICSKLSGGALAMQTPYISKIPIPDASPSDRAAVAALARKCLDAKGAGCEAWEAEMDERVCGLYGL
ncbi:MAG: class I SAM-dependent DNA methyltransferase, partial [Armatimonadetes bacterium]|nr:class I SAM-dependent DNA methyltransferase [Armatimonadota bacterium]